MNHSEAIELMHEFTESDALRKHMYAVEAAVRAYAARFGEDEEKWAIAGLLHDFDYERWPQGPEHTREGAAILMNACPGIEGGRRDIGQLSVCGTTNNNIAPTLNGARLYPVGVITIKRYRTNSYGPRQL